MFLFSYFFFCLYQAPALKHASILPFIFHRVTFALQPESHTAGSSNKPREPAGRTESIQVRNTLPASLRCFGYTTSLCPDLTRTTTRRLVSAPAVHAHTAAEHGLTDNQPPAQGGSRTPSLLLSAAESYR